jgi:hypothetical protein
LHSVLYVHYAARFKHSYCLRTVSGTLSLSCKYQNYWLVVIRPRWPPPVSAAATPAPNACKAASAGLLAAQSPRGAGLAAHTLRGASRPARGHRAGRRGVRMVRVCPCRPRAVKKRPCRPRAVKNKKLIHCVGVLATCTHHRCTALVSNLVRIKPCHGISGNPEKVPRFSVSI